MLFYIVINLNNSYVGDINFQDSYVPEMHNFRNVSPSYGIFYVFYDLHVRE